VLAAAIAIAARAEATPAPLDDRPPVRALTDELARSLTLELPGAPKPYFVAYSMWELSRASVTAVFGAITHSSVTPSRTVDIDVRVGDRSFDNTNFGSSGDRGRSVTLPADADYDAIRRSLWLATDRQYKSAALALERKRAVVAAEAKDPDDAGAFSIEPVAHVVDERAPIALDQARLEALAKSLSAVLRKNADVFECSVAISAGSGRHYYVSSEGAASVQTLAFVHVEVEVHTQAADGMPLDDSVAFWAPAIDQLPSDAQMLAEVAKLSAELTALRKAPILDDYAGPMIVRGRAAGQVVRTLLAENFAGTPAPKPERAGARSWGDSELVGKIGTRILPLGVSVVDDPVAARVGAQKFDEEGIPAQKVSLVENGVFKRFLMSRIPRKGFEHSNGHAVATPYASLRAHPANLIVTSTRAVGDAELARRARAFAKEQGLPYYVVADKLATHRSDATRTSAETTIQAPVILRRVYMDGHEELVRGASFGAFPVRALRDLLAVGATGTAYTYLGSGLPERVSVSRGDSPGGFVATIVAPALLVRDIEVKKPLGAQRQAPIAPRP
jgi:hypothetical protein